MSEMTIQAGPYTRTEQTVGKTMRAVMIALLPATLWGCWLFGWPAVWLCLITIAASMAAESLCLRLRGKPSVPALADGSAILTGWLLALSLPPWAPWWIGVVGALLAIVIGKQVFGGLGQNLFNPAMVARVALLISFPLEMTQFIAPLPLHDPEAPGILEGLLITLGQAAPETIDAMAMATPLGMVQTGLTQHHTLSQILPETASTLQLIEGQHAGSLGEGSAWLVLAGGLFLLARGIISWTIPVAMVLGLVIPAQLLHWVNPELYLSAWFHLFSGAFMLGVFFIATDLVTSPVTVRGQLLFGAGCGLLVYIIRTFAGYPEGVGFAILLMNACTPLIDYYLKPRIYGRNRKGQPLEYPAASAQKRSAS